MTGMTGMMGKTGISFSKTKVRAVLCAGFAVFRTILGFR